MGDRGPLDLRLALGVRCLGALPQDHLHGNDAHGKHIATRVVHVVVPDFWGEVSLGPDHQCK